MLTLFGVPRPGAAQEWVEASSRHFVVVSDAGESRARETARQFEQIRSLFTQLLKAQVDSGKQTVILAAKDEDSLKALLPYYWEVKSRTKVAGVFFNRSDGQYVALRVDATGETPYQVIYHEYAHVVNHLNFQRLPLWLDEGLAEFFSGTVIRGTQIHSGRMHPWHVLLLQNRKLLPLETLVTVDHSSPYYNENERASIFYAEAAALTHYFMVGGGETSRKQLMGFLQLLAQDVEEGEAVKRSFGDLKKLEKTLEAYVRQFLSLEIRAPVEVAKEESSVRALSPAESAAVRGAFLARTGRLEEARALIARALEQDPNLGSAHQSMGVLQLALGQTQEAARAFSMAARLSPQDYLAHYWSATVSSSEAPAGEEFARRERALRRAIELNPRFAAAYEGLARLYYERGERLQEAFSLAFKACEIEPTATFYRLTTLRILRKMGDQAASDLLEQSLARRARVDGTALGLMLGFYAEKGSPAEAESLLRKAEEARPHNVSLLSMRAQFLWGQKRYDEAENAFREALMSLPDSPFLLNGLGYMNADRGVRVEEALALIDTALKKEPEEASYLDSRGWALFRLKRLADAEESLRKAVAKREDPVILDHLGDVLKERGAVKEAVDCWRRAASHLAEGDLKATLEKKIELGRGPSPADR